MRPAVKYIGLEFCVLGWMFIDKKCEYFPSTGNNEFNKSFHFYILVHDLYDDFRQSISAEIFERKAVCLISTFQQYLKVSV